MPGQDCASIVYANRARSSRLSTPIHPARFVVEATKAFPEDGIMVRDGGATVIFQWTYSQAKPHDVIWNQNFGHLGTGLPYAVGASVAEGGKRPVMLLTSDSAFLFHIAELETPVGPRSRRLQTHFRAAIAEGFGCHGEYVEKEDDRGPAIERAYASGKTAVVHVCIDPKANSEEMPK